jgi:hypothetical protein
MNFFYDPLGVAVQSAGRLVDDGLWPFVVVGGNEE